MHVREMNGIVPALLTPFSDGGQVNEPVLRQMVRHMLALGASGFYVCGSTGEGLSLSAGERKAVVETVKAETGDRAGVIVNTRWFSTWRNMLKTRAPTRYRPCLRCITR